MSRIGLDKYLLVKCYYKLTLALDKAFTHWATDMDQLLQPFWVGLIECAHMSVI